MLDGIIAMGRAMASELLNDPAATEITPVKPAKQRAAGKVIGYSLPGDRTVFAPEDASQVVLHRDPDDCDEEHAEKEALLNAVLAETR